MIIYRFRLTSEDHEDFLREIEIQPTQTFLNFHEAILNCANLESCENALFYTTDNKFKKKEEFSFNSRKKFVRKYDDDIDQVVTETYEPHLMKDSVLKKFIDDPHQRLMYEFHGKDAYVLFIELFKVYKTDECFALPRCVNKKGELPKRVAVTVQPPDPTPEPSETVIVAPVIPVVSSGSGMFTEMQEDDAELAEIEGQLDEILEDETFEIANNEAASNVLKNEGIYPEFEDREEEVNPEHMESLDEYDDIEDLEIKHGNFYSDPDDY